ncbi:phosphoadenosine phosphosulfate reductase domain-containing protein [Clostridium sp. Marseille-QA1073]
MYIQDIDLKLKDWAFSQRKNLPYELKLQLTRKRIVDWYEHWQGAVYISFSGGLDSTVLLYLVRQELGDNIPAVFADTGLEYPELVEFVKGTPNVEVIKPKMNFRKVLKEYGYPIVSKETAAKIRKLRHGNLSNKYRNYLLNGDERGKMGKLAEKWKFLIDAPFDTSEKCCDVMKKAPFREYHKRTGRVPYIGVTQDESFMRERQYSKTGCNVYDAGKPKSQPLGFWKKQDILRFAYEKNIEIASVYGDIVYENGVYRTTKEQRTGCVYCAFGCHLEEEPNRFQRLEKTHPKLWSYCMKDINEGGLGLAEVLDYINVPYMSNVTAMKDGAGTNYQQYKLDI